MPLIKGLFFDLDGTLVDTYEADYLAYRDAITEVAGIVIKRDAFNKTTGMVMSDKLAILVPELDQSEYVLVAKGKKHYYPKYIEKTEINESVIQFLTAQSEDLVKALVTTAAKDNAEIVLKHHNLKQYFDFCVYGDEVTKHKPEPECYLLALERANLKAFETVAFEDSESGVQAAEAAGLSVIPIKMLTK